MTSVPLPLKFLRPHYDDLVAFFEKSTKGKANTSALADILSESSHLEPTFLVLPTRCMIQRYHPAIRKSREEYSIRKLSEHL